MSESQRCANVINRYKLACVGDSIKQGCLDATVKELERQALRIATLVRENEELREGENESDRLRTSLSDLLTRIAVAAKGEPPLLTLLGSGDLPELVAALAKDAARYRWLRDRMQIRFETSMSGDKRPAFSMRNGHAFCDSMLDPARGWMDPKNFDEKRERIDDAIDSAIRRKDPA